MITDEDFAREIAKHREAREKKNQNRILLTELAIQLGLDVRRLNRTAQELGIPVEIRSVPHGGRARSITREAALKIAEYLAEE